MSKRVIITGGGTGGHIFPAISIGNALRQHDPNTEILFVGAEGGMEMTLVPKAGFNIKSVRISGIARQITLKNIQKNLAFPFKLIGSLSASRRIIKDFRPDVVIGVGGYASGPVGRVASKMGIPLVINEQNAYPGITNKWLAGRASRILLGNAAAAKFFAKSKTKVTGNPVRASLFTGTREGGLKLYGFDPNKSTVLAVGGSLGAKALNDALESGLAELMAADIQLIWQCGKRYYEGLKPRIAEHANLRLVPFIEDMASTFAVADLVISRAGASTISELILLNKPSILLPSPNVAEDHQTKNAMSLVDQQAARLVKDVDAKEKLVPTTLELLGNPEKLEALRKGIEKIEKHDAAQEILEEILAVMK
ncbi:MAG TPA: undecaprenyldiphospho-muramoylpentapeptide beta-N-acetylglucosaminyltransferase [Bacteroidetes bacterium]|nr:undecaprenyldiphospho-muramoylpentapeptide beta-N-acetylglucosaminyltransferase [Bacteroidota bacterium]